MLREALTGLERGGSGKVYECKRLWAPPWALAIAQLKDVRTYRRAQWLEAAVANETLQRALNVAISMELDIVTILEGSSA